LISQQARKPNSVLSDHLSRPLIALRLERTTFHPDKIMNHLIQNDIEACIGTYSLSLLPYFKQKGNCLNGNKLFYQQICLPLYPQMTEQDQDYIVEKFREGIQRYG